MELQSTDLFRPSLVRHTENFSSIGFGFKIGRPVHEKLDTLTPAHKSRRRHLHEIILYAIILKLTGLNLAQMAGLF